MIPIRIPFTHSIQPIKKKHYEKQNFKICPQIHFQLLQEKALFQGEALC